MDLAYPADLASEGCRVLFTLAGVGIAVIGTFLAGLLRKRTARTAQQSPAHRTRQVEQPGEPRPYQRVMEAFAGSPGHI